MKFIQTHQLLYLVFVTSVCGLTDANLHKRCRYPCQCPVRELKCATGIATLKDGCDCCYMCARQHGDLCNVKDVCDAKQGLYCDMDQLRGPGTGICRAKESKPCEVNNKTYKDGEKFKPECSRLCTCQNGNYGCVDLCPDEYRVPSETHCRKPRLMSVRGQCCKQWTCDMEPQKPEYSTGKSPRHLIAPQHMELRAPVSDKRSNTATINSYQNSPPECTKDPKLSPCSKECGVGLSASNLSLTNTATMHSYQNSPPECTKDPKWSPCSKECGVGLSLRHWEKQCNRRNETRLCYIRPCQTQVAPRKHGKCTPTTRIRQRQKLQYEDCISVREMNFKFCTNCKKHRCCYPRKTKTRKVEFECGEGRRQEFALMWIKSCRCDRQCYVKDHDDKPWLKNNN